MRSRLINALEAAGLPPAVAAAKAELFSLNLAALSLQNGDANKPVRHYFVPGRLELLGKHTDYIGGRSLLGTVERGVCITVTPRKDRRVCVIDVARDFRGDFTIAEHLPVVPGYWLTYPIIVGRRLARDFPGLLRGADVAFSSNLHQGAGMSSSSALVVAFFLALSDINSLTERAEYRAQVPSPEDLAGYLGAIEHGLPFTAFRGDNGVHVTGGSEGQAAMLLSRPSELREFSFLPLKLERVAPFPAGHQLALAVSGVSAAKGGDALDNQQRTIGLAGSVLRIIRERCFREGQPLPVSLAHDPLRSAELRAEVARVAALMEGGEQVLNRFDHFVAESHAIVPAASAALIAGDLGTFGELVERSQTNAERLLANQVPQTVALVRSARELGAVAATSFGAGFGGSVWALVEADRSQDFLAKWSARYQRRFPPEATNADFFLTKPGAGVIQI